MRTRSVKKAAYLRSEKWPREYAFDILKLRTKEERKECLENVPDKFKKLTMLHVKLLWSQVRGKK